MAGSAAAVAGEDPSQDREYKEHLARAIDQAGGEAPAGFDVSAVGVVEESCG